MPKGVTINELTPKKGNSTQVSLVDNGNGDNGQNRVMYVDSHEPIDICEKLKQKGIPAEVTHLNSSDYCFSNIGIERKTLTDLWGSITSRDKRIWRQMFELKRNFERPYLIVEKFNFIYLRSPLYSNQIWGTLARISLLGINVITIANRTSGSKEFVEFLTKLYFSADKRKKSYKPLPKKSEKPKNVFMDSLCMVPDIGPGTAKKIIARYSSFEELCEVGKEELSSLCGKTRVKFLWRILHGEII